MVVLKPKRTRHFKFRDGRRQVKAMTTEPKRTYLGTVDLAAGETLAVAFPAGADAGVIRKAIEAAEAEKAEETSRLRRTFGLDVDKEGPSDK